MSCNRRGAKAPSALAQALCPAVLGLRQPTSLQAQRVFCRLPQRGAERGNQTQLRFVSRLDLTCPVSRRLAMCRGPRGCPNVAERRQYCEGWRARTRWEVLALSKPALSLRACNDVFFMSCV